MTRLGVVTAHDAEAALLRPAARAGTLEIAVGGRAGGAREAVAALVQAKVDALVSFGIAAALAPAMRPGDVVIGDPVVLASGATIATDEDWRQRLVARLTAIGVPVKVARVVGGDEVPPTPGDKYRTFQATFAATIDTESHVVAEVGKANGLPFLVVRAVSEPAEHAGSLAMAGAPIEGQPLGRVSRLARLATRPWDLPEAWRATQEEKLAFDALRQIALLPHAPFAFERG